MRPRLVLTLVLLHAAVAGGCNGESGPLRAASEAGAGDTALAPDGGDAGEPAPDDRGGDRGPVLTGARSFVVRGKLALSNPEMLAGRAPDRHDFVLRVDPAGPTLILGGRGWAVRVPARTSDGVTFVAEREVDARIEPDSQCGSSGRYDHFQVTVTPAGLVGQASGVGMIVIGDVVSSQQATLTMTGLPDDAGPGLGEDRTVDPLSVVEFVTDEPLPAGATARLVSATHEVALEPTAVADPPAVVGFRKPPGALRYGAVYELAVQPFVDLAGNAGRAAPRLTTGAPPPLVPEDGFEGGAAGGALVVDANTLPPIGGQRSVLFAPRSGFGYAGSFPFTGSPSLTVRLAVAAGDSRVRLAVRPIGVFASPASTYDIVMQVAVPGGATERAILPPNEDLTTEVPAPSAGPQGRVWLGAVRTVEIPLPAGAGPEVVFQLAHGPPLPGCGLAPPTAGYLVDDLRVE